MKLNASYKEAAPGMHAGFQWNSLAEALLLLPPVSFEHGFVNLSQMFVNAEAAEQLRNLYSSSSLSCEAATAKRGAVATAPQKVLVSAQHTIDAW